MPGRKEPLALFATSLALALLGDLLLRGATWGVNVGLWAVAVALACLAWTRPTRTEKALGATTVLFASLFSLRDSDSLRGANGFAMALALGAMLLPPTGRLLREVSMLWLVLAFVWLFVTTLVGQPRRLAIGLFATGLLTILVTNLANPDRIIVETNLAKPQADFEYLKGLGDDAVLALRARPDLVPPEHRPAYENLVRNRTKAAARGDWRELDLARWSLAH